MPQPQKITKLSQVTLEPNLLYANRDAIATDGRVHAMALQSLRVEGVDYANDAIKPDVHLPHPAIAKLGCELFAAVAQQIADETQTIVEYLVQGEVRRVTPK
jgi:hypothetical protein